jgi:hypothetical protein
MSQLTPLKHLALATAVAALMTGCGGDSSGGSSGSSSSNSSSPNNSGAGPVAKTFSVASFGASDLATVLAASVPGSESAASQSLAITVGKELETSPTTVSKTDSVADAEPQHKDVSNDVRDAEHRACQAACAQGVTAPNTLRRFEQLAEGDTVSLNVSQTGARATCQKMNAEGDTVHCTILAEVVSGTPVINKAQALAIATAFDSNNPFKPGSGIYDQVRAIYGSEWNSNPVGGRDGDLKINLVILSSNSIGGSSLFGFFSPSDEFASSQISTSNQGEFLYLNVAKFTGDGFDLYSTIAHEFQHMVAYNVKLIHQGLFNGTQENVSIDEGRAVLCEELTGFGLDAAGGGNRFIHNVSDAYLRDMSSFAMFSFGARNGDYGKGYLLMRYLRERFGDSLYSQVVQNPNRTGLSELALFGDFSTLFIDWGTALIGSNLTGSVPSQFRYASGFRTNSSRVVRGLGNVALPGPQPSQTFNPPRANLNPSLLPYSFSLFNYSGGTGGRLDLSATVSGTTGANFVVQSPVGTFSTSR